MSLKQDCGHHHHHNWKKLFSRRVFVVIFVFVIVILFAIFLVWAILRPSKPQFTLQDATVYQLNISDGNYLTSNFQVTVSSRNPNGNIGIYYDRLDVYATYGNQQITLPTRLPPTYQGHKDINVWSPFVYGMSVPIAPYLAASFYQQHNFGTVFIKIKINGHIRWKVGTWISGGYHIYINCPAYITFGSRNTGIPVGTAFKYQLVQSCGVDV
ncbi:PREDICTED: NDR1/HIN1-like protein 12 [Nelumbo nucifera]|uniref:NDR1/HIN1-like protein 12 n=2 Tax=Nelumbo nucifera TaxID=4432 RepID=A0A1U7Z1C1_NELNU|nr:PREDICTED: NDR1/HIN1-like protein 12 [Nelumbo nucifera]DAD48394.1 TPA_asm: hypothetical protein HUJ06_018331 [Nelumbo nucifera]